MAGHAVEQKFINDLAESLRDREEDAVAEFELRKGFAADLFLPAMPRGVVEVKMTRNFDVRAVSARFDELTRTMPDLQRYLVAPGDSNIGLSSTEGIRLVPLDGDPADAGTAAKTANRLALLRRSDRLAWNEWSARSLNRLPGRRRDGGARGKKLVSAASPVEATVAGLLVSLEQLVGAEFFAVIQAEIDELVREFRNDHFTACALRMGRALEFTVYAVARALGVPVEDAVLDGIEKLQSRLDDVNTAVLDHVEADAAARARTRRRVLERGVQLQAGLLELLVLLDESPQAQPSRAPRNIEAILRSIRKQVRALDGPRRAMDDLLQPAGAVRAALRTRNKAAHADARLVHAEVGRREVTTMLHNLGLVLLGLTNVVAGIAAVGPSDQ